MVEYIVLLTEVSMKTLRTLIRESIVSNLEKNYLINEDIISPFPNLDIECYHSDDLPPDKFLAMMNRMPEEDLVINHSTNKDNPIDFNFNEKGFIGQIGGGSGMHGVGLYTSLYGGDTFDTYGS